MESEDVDPPASACQFYLEGRCRFADQCRNLHPPAETALIESEAGDRGEVSATPSIDSVVTVNDHSQSTNWILKESIGGRRQGRTRMRTAQDVLNRVCWDASLDADEFSVVYLDRFVGAVTVPLRQFQSAVEDGEVMVPQHRIQQIVYRQRHVVWEKLSRTDLVFGSTGYRGTINDFIGHLERHASAAATMETPH